MPEWEECRSGRSAREAADKNGAGLPSNLERAWTASELLQMYTVPCNLAQQPAKCTPRMPTISMMNAQNS